MSDKSLYRLFYSDTNKFKAEYERRFNDENTIHLDMDIGEYPAFVCQSPQVLKLIISIERADKTVNKLCGKLPGIAFSQFRNRCLVDEIMLTNFIEGVNSTRREISDILQSLPSSSRRRFSGIVKRYDALTTNEIINLNESRDIRKIYDDIFCDEISSDDLPDGDVFRKNAVSVYSESGREIHKGLLPEKKIIETMDKSLDFLNGGEGDILLRIAVFHYLFGYIHPFYDGNGRTDRFISSYMLAQNLNNLIAYRLSYTVKENLKEYYKAFKVCNHPNNRGDLTPFAEMFLEIVFKSMFQLNEALIERIDKLSHYNDRICQFPNADNGDVYGLYKLLVQAALFSDNGISVKELQENMGLSYNTVKVRLKLIPEKLIVTNRQNNRLYYMLDLMQADEMSQ